MPYHPRGGINGMAMGYDARIPSSIVEFSRPTNIFVALFLAALKTPLLNITKKFLRYCVVLLSVACSEDNTEPSCSPKVKADLFNSSMKVDQVDDHHFMVTTQVTNLAKGACSESSLQTFGTLKVYFGPNASVDESHELVYEKTFSLSVFAPLEKRNLTEIVNLYELGYYHFVWTLDHQNVVDESDETNNVIVRTHWKQN